MTDTRTALVARAQSLGLHTRAETEGLLCWWDDEDPTQMLPLLWDCPYDGVVSWLEGYAPRLVAQRGIVVAAGSLEQMRLL
jgi:hypothetical protein